MKTPYMQLFVSDYLGDTRHLTTEQHGAYLLLLMSMWNAGGSLPNDPKKLSNITGLSARKWRTHEGDLMAFFEVNEETISSARLVKEYQKAVSKSELRRNAGRQGGEAKALKNNDSGLAKAKAKDLAKGYHLPYPERKKDNSLRSLSKENDGKTQMSESWRPDKKSTDHCRNLKLTNTEFEDIICNFSNYWISKKSQKVGWKNEKGWNASFRTWAGKEAATLKAQYRKSTTNNSPGGNSGTSDNQKPVSGKIAALAAHREKWANNG